MQDQITGRLKSVLEQTSTEFNQDNKFHQDRLLRISIRKAGIRSTVFRSGSTTTLLTAAASLHAATVAQMDLGEL
jgi:hypothetical protein